MAVTPAEIAASSSTNGTEPGWLSSELEQREARRRSFDAGLKQGATRILYSPTLETMALEISLLRSSIEAMVLAAEKQQRVIDWYETKLREFAHHILTREKDK